MRDQLAMAAVLAVALLLLMRPGFADIAPANVVYDATGAVFSPLSDRPGDPVAGKRVYTEKKLGNCVACHANRDSDADFQGNIGPALDGSGDRWSIAQLRGIVADAKRSFPDSMMPSHYKTQGYIRPGQGFTARPASEPLPPLLTAQQIEDVVAYLVTLKE